MPAHCATRRHPPALALPAAGGPGAGAGHGRPAGRGVPRQLSLPAQRGGGVRLRPAAARRALPGAAPLLRGFRPGRRRADGHGGAPPAGPAVQRRAGRRLRAGRLPCAGRLDRGGAGGARAALCRAPRTLRAPVPPHPRGALPAGCAPAGGSRAGGRGGTAPTHRTTRPRQPASQPAPGPLGQQVLSVVEAAAASP